MAITYTSSQVRVRALIATDHENDSFVAAAEAYEILSVANTIFWRKLVDVHPGYFAEATADSWTADGLIHSLPAAFGRLIAVEYSPTTDIWVDIPEAHPADIAEYTGLETILGAAAAYRMDGEKIHLLPAVKSGSYRARYYAGPTKISAGTETIDTLCGGDEFCSMYLQAYIKRKEEADVRPYEMAYQRILEELDHARNQRVMNQAHSIRDAAPYENRKFGPLWGRRRYW